MEPSVFACGQTRVRGKASLNVDGTTNIIGVEMSTSTALGSWKEIAAYLGKGVRTAQRYESQLGLPVRRPDRDDRKIVFALPDELDAWIRGFRSKDHARQPEVTTESSRPA